MATSAWSTTRPIAAGQTQVPIPAPRAGFVQDVDAMGVALAALRLGAGRARRRTRSTAVGVNALVKIGERVESGGRLCVIHANDGHALDEAGDARPAIIG